MDGPAPPTLHSNSTFFSNLFHFPSKSVQLGWKTLIHLRFFVCAVSTTGFGTDLHLKSIWRGEGVGCGRKWTCIAKGKNPTPPNRSYPSAQITFRRISKICIKHSQGE